MNRDEVPDDYRPVRCTACGDYLAVPYDVTADDVEQVLRQHAEIVHKTPDDWPSYVKYALEQTDHDGDVDACPVRGDAGHCGHWHYGADCCDCSAPARPLPSFQAPRGPVIRPIREAVALPPPPPPEPDDVKIVLSVEPDAITTYRRAIQTGHLPGILSLFGASTDDLLSALLDEIDRLRTDT
jgi:hypothetical protein